MKLLLHLRGGVIPESGKFKVSYIMETHLKMHQPNIWSGQTQYLTHWPTILLSVRSHQFVIILLLQCRLKGLAARA